MVTFTEEILNGKLHFLCSGGKISPNRTAVAEASTGNLARHHFEPKSQVKENDIKQMIERVYKLELAEPKVGFKETVPNLEEVCHLKTSVF